MMRVMHFLSMTLDEYLTVNGITDAAFAMAIGRSQSSVNRLRRGETRPDWKTLKRISEATNGAVTPNDFMGVPDPLLGPQPGEAAE